MKTYELKLNGNYQVVTANDLIKGKQKMTLREAQLLFITMSQVVKQDKDFKTYTTTVPELASFLGVSPKSLYRDLEGICENLMKRVIKIKQGQKWKMFHWISRAEYDSCTLTIRLSDDIQPFLLELVGNYTQTLLSTLLTFKSWYTARLYQLIVCERTEHREEKEKWALSIDEIREFFDLSDDEYTQATDLIKNTIQRAINELNQNDTVYISSFEKIYKKHGRGRSLIGVSFEAIVFPDASHKEAFLRYENVFNEWRNEKPKRK